MNAELRKRASAEGMPLMDYILKRIHDLRVETGVSRTLLAVCPNSTSVITAALKSAKRCNAPLKFAATLNQVDLDGGYTGLTPAEFVKTIRIQAEKLNITSPIIVAIDHGGPWLKDLHRTEKWQYPRTMEAVKKSFEAAIEAGYDLIHVDPTVDITLTAGKIIRIETVAERTIELIRHAEEFRKKNGYPAISYEAGTEEVHGGLADLQTFRKFLGLLKQGLAECNLKDVWPCFIVGKVGTDLHTTTFDPEVAGRLSAIAGEYGSCIKGHYSDNVANPEAYPVAGMGAANVGPEFTEREYDGLMELAGIQDRLIPEGKIARPAQVKKVLRESVIASGRWKKWLQPGENSEDFCSLSEERQEWLVKTGCRYIWENPEVLSTRFKLYENLSICGIKPSEIVESSIENAIDKYFHRFNLTDLNNLL